MRRKDREISNRAEIIAILKKCDVCRLAIHAPDYPYIVPMNFGFTDEGGHLTLWFHCAAAGRKLDLLRVQPLVGFEADTDHALITGPQPCDCAMSFTSVIGCGKITVCDDPAEKREALVRLMRHYHPDTKFAFTDKEAATVTILKLEVTRITGKRRPPATR